ncbi:MAG: Fic family protein [Bdellovibrio sp.]|nr:Fic family protein [Bdellovibrio sp.]
MKQFKTAKWFVTSGLLATTLLASVGAQAISDPCALAKVAVPAQVTMSRPEIKEYEYKLKRECDLTTQFRDVRAKLQERFQVGLSNINEYQGIRFLRRSDFEDAKNRNIPIAKKYQLLRSMDALPVAERKSIIWDNWSNGLTQLDASSDKIMRGEKFTVEDLQRVHSGFYTLTKEDEGDESNAPNPGTFKPKSDNDYYWWDFATRQESDAAKAIVTQINDQYRAMGLLEKVNGDYADILRVKRDLVKIVKGKLDLSLPRVDGIYAGDSRVNEAHVHNIINFVNGMFDQALLNQHMVWKGKLMTPAEVAYLAQKFYVGVHPFADGNGRTSRFIQEVFLTTFDMPTGASGDLMENDIIIPFPEYYQRAITMNLQLMDKMDKCIQSYSTNHLKSYDKIKANASVLEYGCRLMQN